MNAERRTIFLSGAAIVVASVLAQACWAKDPCGEGLVLEHEGNTCVPARVADAAPPPASPAEAGGDGGSEAAPGEAAAASSFGKTCTSSAECGGDAPVCAAPLLPYCTQINCQPGEANAGACPAGYTCMTAPGYPSGCMQN
ncbi:MAG TPA: hypothetical protein VLT33_08340 [Labilithrix sp.]|nr:hypothetical protein [Labilithrix sp.]